MDREYTVVNSPSEGDHKIRVLVPVRFSWVKCILMWLSIVLTAFVLGLVLKWFDKLYNMFIYVNSSFQEATHLIIKSADGEESVCKVTLQTLRGQSIKSFEYRYLRYIIPNATIQVLQLNLDELTNQTLFSSQGLNDNLQVQMTQQIYGKCRIEIPQIGILPYLFEVLTAPFQILLYISLFILLSEGLFNYAIAILVASAAAIVAQYLFLRQSNKELQELAYLRTQVLVDRAGMKTIENIDLLPGDILMVQPNTVVPCDCIMIRGDVMVNEASLTGESVPVPKVPLPPNDQLYENSTSNTLFEGTKVVQTIGDCHALVIRTGYTTLKGQYFRNVLFPKKQDNPFYLHALKFTGGICIMMHIFYFISLYYYEKMGYERSLIFVRWLFVATWIFPPQVPIAIQIKGAMALLRLRSNKIIGRNIDKIQIAGKTNIVCFDKTGTLTNLGMNVKGIWKAHEPQLPMRNTRKCHSLEYMCMATCHHVLMAEGELQGDIMDVEMFKFSEWEIEFNVTDAKFVTRNAHDTTQSLKVLRIFDFDSSIAMMSVLVRDDTNDRYILFSKGSPERIAQKSRHWPEGCSLQLNDLTHKGYRVLALTSKNIDDINLNRQDYEKDLEFIGFLYFENQLKNDTSTVIKELNAASLSLKIISGDNALTTIQCAKQCSIIQQKEELVTLLDVHDATLFRVQTIKEHDLEEIKYKWEELSLVCNDLLSNDKTVLSMSGPFIANFEQDPFETGRSPMAAGNPDLFSLNTSKLDRPSLELLNKLVMQAKVFARYIRYIKLLRMKPEQKRQVVKNLQDQNNIVAMIGDGANDCSAISQANVGISFCSSDASYTAPFAYQGTSIDCIVTLLAVGRQNTISISIIFQFLVAAFVVGNTGRLIMVYEAQGFGDMQTIYLVFMHQIPIIFLVGLGRPLNRLSDSIPMDNQFLFRSQLAIYYQIFCIILNQLFVTLYIVNNEDHIYNPPQPPIQKYIYVGALESSLFPVTVIGNTSFLFCMYQTYPYQGYHFVLQVRTNLPYLRALAMVPHSLDIWNSTSFQTIGMVECARIGFRDVIYTIVPRPNFQYILLGFIVVQNFMMIAGSIVLDHFLPRSHRMHQGRLLN